MSQKFIKRTFRANNEHFIAKQRRGDVCEICRKKFTADSPDINYQARMRIMHIHQSCQRKAHLA